MSDSKIIYKLGSVQRVEDSVLLAAKPRYVECQGADTIAYLVNKTITAIWCIVIDDDHHIRLLHSLFFGLDTGCILRMYHDQACCENVRLEDVIGDLQDLLNSPVILAEERSFSSESNGTMLPNKSVADAEVKSLATITNPGPLEDGVDSYTWTFYEIATNKGSITLRWYGESNGHYSESVEIEAVEMVIEESSVLPPL